jgi:predicted ArsR family transcriptional regulator
MASPKGPSNGQTTRDQVRRLVLVKGLTPRQAATELGVSTQAIYFHLKSLRQEVAS